MPHERQLARLPGRKDEFQYGDGVGRSEDAASAVAQLNSFAVWARGKLAEAGVVICEAL
jgi:hypothetical protein